MRLTFLLLVFIVTSSWRPADVYPPEDDISCMFVDDLKTALLCAGEAQNISAYSEKWPENTNSTLFFNLIRGNTKLTNINFCRVFIDSLPSTIADVPNLSYLQLSYGAITYLPSSIGKLKKLRTLSFGNSRDECKGNKIKFIPKEIGECIALEHLELAYSEVTDLPKELDNCKNLKTIDLYRNTMISPEKIMALKRRFPDVVITF